MERRGKDTNRNRWGIIAVDNMVREERDLVKELKDRERNVQRREEDTRIKKAKYNREYKAIIKEDRGFEYKIRMK